MDNNIKTQHIKYNGYFYFLLAEKIGLPIFTIWSFLLLSLAFFADKYAGSEVLETPSNVFLIFLSIAIIFLSIALAVFGIIPAYYRARFLRTGGYCIITTDYIESVCCGKTKRYDYKNRSIKTKKYKDGSTDIFIGKSFFDVLKHCYIVLTPAYFRAMKSLLGFGAPLYRVTNADEVLSYLEANK